ncbi:hypothetical protein ABGN05_28475 [Aquibium sp. LZ166]|uniref:Uncharacterized protein n=1 Tax=Aquibium pacificus TaxID=3153579 RepID=A0ABV3SUJ9_9HYPH
MLVTAVLVQWRPLAALWLHAVLVLGALALAVWEFGFDWWQPAPRGVVIIIAFRLLTPGWVNLVAGSDRRLPPSRCGTEITRISPSMPGARARSQAIGYDIFVEALGVNDPLQPNQRIEGVK